MLVFNYVYRIDINIERLISCSNKQLALEKYTLQILLSLVQATKYDRLSLQVKALYNQSALQVSLSCFLLMLLTESFYLFLLASLE